MCLKHSINHGARIAGCNGEFTLSAPKLPQERKDTRFQRRILCVALHRKFFPVAQHFFLAVRNMKVSLKIVGHFADAHAAEQLG